MYQACAELQQSRRSIIVQTGAAAAAAFGFLAVPALADEQASTSVSKEGKPRKALVDTESWYRFKGEGFRMFIPPDYEDLVEYDVSLKMPTPASFQFWLIVYTHSLLSLLVVSG